MLEIEEDMAKIIYEILMEDISHKRLDIGVRGAAFDTTVPREHPEIRLTTDDTEIILVVTVNPMS